MLSLINKDIVEIKSFYFVFFNDGAEVRLLISFLPINVNQQDLKSWKAGLENFLELETPIMQSCRFC